MNQRISRGDTEKLTSAYNHTLLRRNKTQRLVEYYGQMFIRSTEYTIYQTISYPKICPDRQVTYPDFPKLVRIPALAGPQNPANPVRIAPRCRSKNLKSCPDWDLSLLLPRVLMKTEVCWSVRQLV